MRGGGINSTRLPGPSITLNKDIQAYVEETRRAAGGDSWTSKPELPTNNEVLGKNENGGSSDENVVGLLPNQLQGPWPSTGMYLKTHYDLLREDAVAPLRDAVAYVREDPQMKDSPDVCIYEKVHIVGLSCADNGIAMKLTFSTARAGKNIVWEYSPRLTTGNIVALTPASDMFKSKCSVAVVAARPLEGLKNVPSEIDIFFARAEDAEFDPQQEFVMVEARNGYYEASRHTLTALQKMGREGFPFSEYLCGLQPTIDPPEYIKTNPFVDMSSTLVDEECAKIDVLNDWPPPPKTLDSSQWDALHQILTRRLAIVQGPPGTGKTHVSVIALRSLLSTLPSTDPPVIIAAQTNHALDQLLRHIACFEMNYVRLGGRSADPDIKKRTIFELKKANPVPAIPGGLSGPSRKQLRALSENIMDLLLPFAPDNSKSPLPAFLLLKLDIITQAQYDSLVKGAEGWVHAGDQVEPLSAWLGDNKVKFEVVYKANNFGFLEDEIDLEYEQLKELELEQGIDEEDTEMLRGPYMSLMEQFKGRKISEAEMDSLPRRYLKQDDLWEIPANARSGVYSVFQKLAKQALRTTFRTLAKGYEVASRNLQTGKWELNSTILQSARVVGMTTTGLSKYRALISSLKPKIIMIEEAAEVIEAPIAAACVKSLEHLILVGDHKQLQGSCAVKELEGEPFYLKVSLFERLVHNGVEFRMLTKQRRMAPEIRRVLAPIYDDLEDHPSVLDRPEVPGMGGINSFFFCHGWPESSDSLLSKYNENEARMVVGFFIYLHMNKVSVKDITILTFYNGQRKKILKALRDNHLLQGQYLKVSTVDSYQGEENEIVILSLVRSSENNMNIGFLSVENRVCVALSRAKRGFYIFGNAEQLAVASPLWWEVSQIVSRAPKRIGYHVPLTCTNHQTKTYVGDPDKWDACDGGCSLRCEDILICGHKCPLRCHVIPHEQVRCQQPCRKALKCGHPCAQVCDDLCKCQYENCEVEDNNPVGSENVPPGVQAYPTLIPTPAKPTASPKTHAAMVKDYNDYANGGAAIDDARLALEARKMSINAPQPQRVHQGFFDLLGDSLIDIDSPIMQPKPTENPTVERPVSTRQPGKRQKYVQFFSSWPSPANGGANGGGSLI
ncbi:hypothetical protein AJ79_01962 [Helicocarpus griseus UAMH5409]|uniref:Helicase required for RNAi-mediated heterochromatin assembly 1 n=1 Tax=Helicocarpus griseus UAMH5409 TaxID=1447875 RepID=A0A2B7Y4S5_9EURO|nr:hypothetical protein AJ79_01962 [Helicocarpus griseus UAMH5409]